MDGHYFCNTMCVTEKVGDCCSYIKVKVKQLFECERGGRAVISVLLSLCAPKTVKVETISDECWMDE